MILTITLNAALDITYPVPALLPHTSHRVDVVHERAGGKGLNVARVLHDAGSAVLATGLVGGATGEQIRRDLDAAGIRHHFTGIGAESRRTVAVIAADSGDATIFNERGPKVRPDEWSTFLTSCSALLPDADVIVCSGSLPGGLDDDAYAELVRLAGDVPVIVDCEGPALLAAAAAGATLVKPNLAEVRAATGLYDPVAGGRTLLDLGAGAVVVSLGADGLLALTPEGVWRAGAGERLTGNPTGAGDACVAALAVGLQRDLDWPHHLEAAVAWSAGAVVSPLAGSVDAATSRRIAPLVQIREVPLVEPDGAHTEETHATDTHG